MNAPFLIPLFVCGLPLLGHAENPPTNEQVERLVRTFVFTEKPGENTNVVFKIHKIEIKGLWEGMQVEVFAADSLIDGESFPEYVGAATEFVGAYYNGKITPLTGMYSAMLSGLVSNGQFYYTYYWGSGVGRSQVARLQVANGKLEIVQSPEFWYKDLIVSSNSDGKVRVLSGRYLGHFNHLENATDFGFIGSTNSSGLEIIDAKGNVVTSAY